MMKERDIKELVERLIAEITDKDELAANIADRWHEAVLIADKEAYSMGHTEGYNDGFRDGRDSCAEAKNTEA